MARVSKPLTNTQISHAKPKEKIYRLYDGGGLCLKITTKGAKIWEYRFTNPDTNKQDTIIIGNYINVSLSDARRKHAELSKQVSEKVNPKNKNIDIKFKAIYENWFAVWSKSVTEKHSKQTDSLMLTYCMKYLGHIDINQIKAIHVINALEPIEKAGSLSQIKRAKTCISKVFKFAAERGLCEHNPADIISTDSFQKHESKKMRSLEITDIYTFHEFLKNGNAEKQTKDIAELTLRTMCRIQEMATLRWDFIDMEKRIITIPFYVMKMRKEHVVYITNQAMKIIENQPKINDFVFASRNGHIAKATPANALRNNGMETTMHGVRHLASTVLNESLLFNESVIEACLAHSDKNRVRATYNNAKYLEKRKELLQWWSDFIDMCNTEENNLKALKKFNII